MNRSLLLKHRCFSGRFDGAFRVLDACIACHPNANIFASYSGGSALASIVYEFFGKTSRAAYPVGSRSALDAAVIFDVAVNHLRETIPENTRIHSVIMDGEDVPNVAPA
ncbi:MAG: hypothetical protein PHW60_11275 [Kiritimatiellae bacterium]|nr:hypothetical protein [Kiritimatiellia bacterium]